MSKGNQVIDRILTLEETNNHYYDLLEKEKQERHQLEDENRRLMRQVEAMSKKLDRLKMSDYLAA